ncbi:helix-turn-helix domain-containing protein [Galactobacter caseinivorans]|uniref:XRE family transcriptional regulator n=1 Tax=Galactobacter caseinivorans TaxID=2676123 RepID=A0A496PJA4_9MICC|nr:XRE family transcriptional regulator [Galactobacter caseinivorans]RKW70557.1 XRE family transcriptional regulator [Galactobacter caseinivorans]
MANPSAQSSSPPAPSLGAVLDGLGVRLRTLRERSGATLAQLSATTGISVSTLSRLESGQRRATLELLLPLSREYGVSLDELVTLPTVVDPRITPQAHRDGDRVVQTLTRRNSAVRVFRTRIEAGSATGAGASASASASGQQLMSHPGFDWVYVLAGRLRLVLGEREFVLERGQAAEFDTTTPHWFGAADHRPVDYLSLFTQEGEKAHKHPH